MKPILRCNISYQRIILIPYGISGIEWENMEYIYLQLNFDGRVRRSFTQGASVFFPGRLIQDVIKQGETL